MQGLMIYFKIKRPKESTFPPLPRFNGFPPFLSLPLRLLCTYSPNIFPNLCKQQSHESSITIRILTILKYWKLRRLGETEQRMFGLATSSTRVICATLYSPPPPSSSSSLTTKHHFSSHHLPTTWVCIFTTITSFFTLFLFNGIDFEMGMFRFLHLLSDSGVFISNL